MPGPPTSVLFRDLYLLLAAALHRPRADVLSADFVESARDLCARAGLPLESEIDALATALESSRFDLTALSIEHSRLFVGPFSLLAPPYESIVCNMAAVVARAHDDHLRDHEEGGRPPERPDAF